MTGKLTLSKLRVPAAIGAAALAALVAGPARAVESAASFYLLGSGGPNSAVLPPVEGVFYDNTVYIYSGNAGVDREFVVGGNLVAGLDATMVLDVNTLMWVPTTNFLGGTLVVGALGVFGSADIHAEAVLTGPGGNPIEIERDDDTFTVADPALTAVLGWKSGNLHTSLGVLINLPVGDYHPGRLANVSLNRFAVDTSLGLSWHDDASGWDLSAKVGYTYNGTNSVTDYNSGDELHVEASIEKRLGKSFTLGVLGYYYNQVSADKGAGARLGAFEGEVSAVGGTASYTFMIGPAPVTLRARVLAELDAKNRLEGTAAYIGFSMPLWVNMPKQVE